MDVDAIDYLNTNVPEVAEMVNEECFGWDGYRTKNGQPCNWIERMNDWNNTCRRQVEFVVDNNFCSRRGGRWRHWRLWDRLADYDQPWRELTWDFLEYEYRNSLSPAKEYIRDMCRCYEGEVALAHWDWVYSLEPVPRDAVYWHPQFGRTSEQRAALGALYKEAVSRGRQDVSHNINLRTDIGDTMILRFDRDNVGHWRLDGAAITLAQVFRDFGEHFTVMEIMMWYYHAPKIVKKRPHPQGNADERAAARERYRAYGRYAKRH